MVLIMLIILGILGAIGGNSRGVFVFTVFPAILFLLFTSRRNNLSKKLFFQFASISLIAGFVVVSLIVFVRNIAFTTASWSFSDALDLLATLNFNDFEIPKMISFFVSLWTGRVGGIRELMAVSSSNISGIEIPVKMFMGMSTDVRQSICNSVMDFIPFSGDGLGFGITYGMWGQLFLSKSYLVVYFGTVLLVGIIICIEEIFLRKGLYSVALLVAILLGFQFWGSASMFLLSRFTVLLLICYLTALYVLKKIRKTTLRKKVVLHPKVS